MRKHTLFTGFSQSHTLEQCKRSRSRSLTLTLGSLLIIWGMVACGPRAFQGRFESPPEWVYSDLNSWVSPVDRARQVKVVYGRGSAKGHKLINKRRALGEAQAVQDATQRFIERFVRITGQADTRAQLKQLSWVQIALPVERFFDPRVDTQYVLVQITKASFTRELEFKLRGVSSRDPQSRELMTNLLSYTDKIFSDL